MSKKIQLSIADPCHENWDDMTQAEKGRFCASCQKQVIDFTNMSDPQMAAFFKKPSTGSVCGRFYDDQLDRDIEIPRKRIPWVRYFFQFALPAFLVSMKATAQGNIIVKRASDQGSKPACSATVSPVAPVIRTTLIGDTEVAPIQKQERHALPVPADLPLIRKTDLASINGRVIDENDKPVSYATVIIKETKIGVMADSAGFFKIENPASPEEITLQVSSAGFDAKEIPVKNQSINSNDLLIRLTSRVMDELVVVSYQNFTKTVLTGAISVKTEKTIMDIPLIKSPAEIPAMIKIYPNPVMSGTNINIGCQKLKEGYYSIQLTNQSGQQVLSRQAWIDGEVQVLNIDLPDVPSGIYFLKLTNKETNKRFTQKVLIE